MISAMNARDAMLAHANRQLGLVEFYRFLLEHNGWIIPTVNDAPTILVADPVPAMQVPSMWAFTDAEAFEDACREHTAAGVGPVVRGALLFDAVLALDARVQQLRLNPSSPITIRLQTDVLDDFRRFAGAVRVEYTLRGLAGAPSRTVALQLARTFDDYLVPYFGELGQGHNIVTLQLPQGSFVAAFTAPDRQREFLATGSAEQQAAVRFARVTGAELFGQAAELGDGVILNFGGSVSPIGVMLDVCREIVGG